MIEMVDIYKCYGSKNAVDGISLKVGVGEVFGFLGPNGAGKTTTLKMLTGILRPTSGQIFIGGENIEKSPESCKSIIGFVPDRPYIYEKLRGWEFIEFIMDLYNIRSTSTESLAHEYFELFAIDFAKDQMIEDYSHGMKQKLVILSSLLHRPRVLVIDEPMVGLDPRGARTLKKVFANLASEGVSIFLSTHTMSVAEEVCDRISIINNGKVLATGSMQELRERESSDDSLEALFLKITEEESEEVKG
jgi:ABC-2 type transport system ATP-binding protein